MENKRNIPTFDGIFKDLIVKNKSTWVMVFLSGAVINIITLFTALYSMQVYDRVLPRQGLATLVVLTTGVTICYLLQWIMLKLRHMLTQNLIRKSDDQISDILYKQVTAIRCDQFPPGKGTLSSQLQGYDHIRQFLMTALSFSLVDAPFALMFLFFLWATGGLIVASIPLVILLILLPYGIFQHYRLRAILQEKFASTHRKQGFLLETLRNINSIKAINLRASMTEKWTQLAQSTQDGELKARSISEATSATVQLYQQLGYVGIVAAGAALSATSGQLSSGVILACAILSGRILAPISSIPMLLVQAAQSKTTRRFFTNFFSLVKDNDVIQQQISPANITWTWRFDHVEHQFSGRPAKISAEGVVVNEGARIGVIGETGCGKSTLLQMMAGLFPASRGQIFLDDIDIQQLDRTCLARDMVWLPQEPALFAGTLRENLSIHNPEITDQDIIAVSKHTGLIRLIQNNSAGLDLMIGEDGTGLSGGQKQLVSLTACLISAKPVLLLDEPFSALDPNTENRVMQYLEQLLQEKKITTLIMITHKMSTLKLINDLIVIQPDGQIVMGEKKAILSRLQGKSA